MVLLIRVVIDNQRSALEEGSSECTEAGGIAQQAVIGKTQ